MQMILSSSGMCQEVLNVDGKCSKDKDYDLQYWP